MERIADHSELKRLKLRNKRLHDELKKKQQSYVNMVVSWLREIALNNVDSNREMTFLDAVEDIRERAIYGLPNYFKDKQNGC